MAKELATFEVIIRGTKAGPTQCFRRYITRDSVNTGLKQRNESEMGSPDFTKVFHDAGTVGELWRDIIDQTESDEGIA
ncbi:hypothetical protein LCGC14_0460040 [marine sediment metagenome]|uniref:Uncharacterized protein n=1 Tax=marine sediment metagenome TaxID=412755 RepID=A0A0F9SKF3_9ZZZZ